jgi:hypothetical protein
VARSSHLKPPGRPTALLRSFGPGLSGELIPLPPVGGSGWVWHSGEDDPHQSPLWIKCRRPR